MEEAINLNYAPIKKKEKPRSQNRKILSGLAGLMASVTCLTNTNVWIQINRAIPNSQIYLSFPVKWSISGNGVDASIRTGENIYFTDLRINKRDLDINIDRVGSLPPEISYYSADYQNIYRTKIGF